MFKIGDIVAVCWDGKMARARKGIVLKLDGRTNKHKRILVKFLIYGENEPIIGKAWFRRARRNPFFNGRRSPIPFYYETFYQDEECIKEGWQGAYYKIYRLKDYKKEYFAPTFIDNLLAQPISM